MTPAADRWTIATPAQLDALAGPVSDAARLKETDAVVAPYRAMIEASPFAILATTGPHGLDLSPRGDAPGFVHVEDARTLLLPERRGNNRIDTLRNLVADPRLALLFLIPGIGETLRVSGTARISVDPALLERFAVDGKPPKCVIVLAVERVLFQCARAVLRSRLWEPPPADVRERVPTPGRILDALTAHAIDAEAYDRDLPGRQGATLY